MNTGLLHIEEFTFNGAQFKVVAEINERTEEPFFKQAIYANGEWVGNTEMRFADSVQYVKENFYKFI